MKRLKILFVLACVFVVCAVLSSCSAADLQDGIYTPDGENPQIGSPYLILHKERFNYIQDMAVSYQPSGVPEREGRNIVLSGSYAGEDFVLVFHVRDDKTVVFSGRSSRTSGLVRPPEDDAVFRLWEDE